MCLALFGLAWAWICMVLRGLFGPMCQNAFYFGNVAKNQSFSSFHSSVVFPIFFSSLFWLWFLLAIASTFTFTSFVRFPYDYPVGQRTLYFIYYGFIVAQLFLASWANPPPTHTKFEGRSDT